MNTINRNLYLMTGKNNNSCEESTERMPKKSNASIIQSDVVCRRTVGQVPTEVRHADLDKSNNSMQEKGTEPHRKAVNKEKSGVTMPTFTRAFPDTPVKSVIDEQDDIPESNVHSQKKEIQQNSALQIFDTAMYSFVLSLNPKFIAPDTKKESQEIPEFSFTKHEKSTKTTKKQILSTVCSYIELAGKLCQSWLPIPTDMVQSLATSTTCLSATQMIINGQVKNTLIMAGNTLEQFYRRTLTMLESKEKRSKQPNDDKPAEQKQPTDKTRVATHNENSDNDNDVLHANNGKRCGSKSRTLKSGDFNSEWILKGFILAAICRMGHSVYIPFNDCPSSPIPVPDINTFERIGSSDCYPIDGDYAQTADINAANFSGTIQTPFSGRFDGQCHKIIGLTQSLFNHLIGKSMVINTEFVNYNVTSNLPVAGILCNEITDMAQIKDNHFGVGYVYNSIQNTGIALFAGTASKNSKIISNTGENFHIDAINGYNNAVALGAVIVKDNATVINNVAQHCNIISTAIIGSIAGGAIYAKDNAIIRGNIIRDCKMTLSVTGYIAVGSIHSNGNVIVCDNIVQDSTITVKGYACIGVGVGRAKSIANADNNMAINTVFKIPIKSSMFGVTIGMLHPGNDRSIGQSSMINCQIHSDKDRVILNIGNDQSTTKNIILAGNTINKRWYSGNIERSSSTTDCANLNQDFVRENCYVKSQEAGIYSKTCGEYIKPIYRYGKVDPPVSHNSETSSLRTPSSETSSLKPNITIPGGAPVLGSVAIGGVASIVAGAVVGIVGGSYCIYHWKKGFNDGDRGKDLFLRPVTQTYNYFCNTNSEHVSVPTTEPPRKGDCESSGACK